jgi:two-component system phosphate regulon sensor histidine kinase PhoR
MALSKKKVRLIVFLIAISLAGLLILQTVLLGNAVKLKKQSFDNNVTSVINGIVESLESHHAMAVIVDMAGKYDTNSTFNQIVQSCDTVGIDSIMPRIVFFSDDSVTSEIKDTDSTLLRKITVTGDLDSLCLVDTSLFDSFYKYGVSGIDVSGDSSLISRGNIKFMMTSNSGRIDLIQRVLSRLWTSENLPLDERIDSVLIDSLILTKLRDTNIDLDYIFGVKLASADSLLLGSAEFLSELLETDYRSRLFPYDILAPQVELLLYFPGRTVFIWQQMIPILITICLLMVVIIITFVLTVRTIIRQKRNSQLMAEFVNNMTHEFKTPISTIALATEAILRPDMISNNEKVSEYSGLIRDENIRMRRQAEKILQMAALEEGNLKLKIDLIDIHEVINEAVNNLSLTVAQKGGSISSNLRADKTVIKGDRIHIGGIISNLLDNANKYSPDEPQIKIESYNAEDGIYIRVTDNGVGIKSDDLKMVFDKYFRVSSGNRHDVKGFGLGLSYVKLMVEAHGGNIELKSQYQKGTQAEIFLPNSIGTNQ